MSLGRLEIQLRKEVDHNFCWSCQISPSARPPLPRCEPVGLLSPSYALIWQIHNATSCKIRIVVCGLRIRSISSLHSTRDTKRTQRTLIKNEFDNLLSGLDVSNCRVLRLNETKKLIMAQCRNVQSFQCFLNPKTFNVPATKEYKKERTRTVDRVKQGK